MKNIAGIKRLVLVTLTLFASAFVFLTSPALAAGVSAINSLDQFHNVINSDQPVIINFWATWVGPSRVITPIFEQLANKSSGLNFAKVDVDAQADVAQEVGIRAMPTFSVFRNGKQLDTLVGANPPALATLVNKYSH